MKCYGWRGTACALGGTGRLVRWAERGGWCGPGRSDGFPALFHVVQDFTAVFRDQHQVLHADAESAGQVHARFHGKGHSGFYRVGIGGADVAELVVLQPDGVAQACLLYTSRCV